MRSNSMLSMTVNTKKVELMLSGYQRTLPEALNKSAKKIASMYAYFYLIEAQKAGITSWTGRSFSVLRQQIKDPIKMGNGYGVLVPSTLIAQDQLKKPTIVSLKKGRSISRWAKAKLGKNSGFITIHPHPFIRKANLNAGANVNKITRMNMDEALIRKGR